MFIVLHKLKGSVLVKTHKHLVSVKYCEREKGRKNNIYLEEKR